MTSMMHGFLHIYRSEDGKAIWSRRYFQLIGSDLQYGERPSHMNRHASVTRAVLKISKSQADQYQFRLKSEKVGSMYLRAPDMTALTQWVHALAGVEGVKTEGTLPPPPRRSSSTASPPASLPAGVSADVGAAEEVRTLSDISNDGDSLDGGSRRSRRSSSSSSKGSRGSRSGGAGGRRSSGWKPYEYSDPLVLD